jgi:putative FmdB family regulatory protein
MPPIYEFFCKECKLSFESLSRPYEPVECAHCKMRDGVERKISAWGTYSIKGDNSASATPKRFGMKEKS